MASEEKEKCANATLTGQRSYGQSSGQSSGQTSAQSVGRTSGRTSGRARKHSILSRLCRKRELDGRILDYLEYCRTVTRGEADEGGRSRAKQLRERLPNIAGFCRYVGTGLSDLARFSVDFPDEYDKLLALFEDEVLNYECSATLLSAYLKKRLRYSSDGEEHKGALGDVRYSFEHDIFADGE